MKQIQYSFDDVLLLPKFTNFLPSEVDTQMQLTSHITLKLPFLSAAMDTVTEANMAISIAELGGIGVLHKNMSIKEQCIQLRRVKIHKISNCASRIATIDSNRSLHVLAAIGVEMDDFNRAKQLIISGVSALVIDTSHAHSQNVYNIIKRIKTYCPVVEIIVGNIVTKDAARDLLELGVDALKVGIGPGSICTTRVVAGVGMPQISAIMQVASVCQKKHIGVIADGGIKCSGDIAKAIGAGANCVMLGSLIAGSDESPGGVFEVDGKKYKKYRGMGSIEAMNAGSVNRYFLINKTANLVPQGVVSNVPYKGKLKTIINQLHGGLISSMGYTGNKTITSMRENSEFSLITQSAFKEGHVHSVSSFNETQNYTRVLK